MLNNVVVFDVETTGLSCKSCRVIELAAVKVREGIVVDEFNKLVKIEGELPEIITKITGITKDDLDLNGIEEKQVFTEFKNFIGDSLLVAHNAAFDLGFLHHGLERNGLETFKNDFIDTLTISRERHYFPHKLENMCDRYGIVLNNAHRALADVLATFELLVKFHDEDPIDKLKNTIGYLSKYGVPEFFPGHANIYPTENRYENSYSRW